MDPETVVCGKAYRDGGLRYTEIGISEGKIVAVGRSVPGGDRRIDLGTSVTVLPGFMDPHVHMRDPGMTQKEDFPTGTTAAACAGVTCVLDMPNTRPPVVDLASLMEKKRSLAGRAYADYGLFAALTRGCSPGRMAPHAAAFKLFMGSTTGNLLLNDDEDIAPLMGEVARTGKVVSVHAEDDNLINHDNTENCCQDHLRNRPAEAEYSALRRLAQYREKVKINICHCTNAEQVRIASSLGFTTEITMHHLLFDAASHPSAFYKVNPPLRDAVSCDGLRRAFVSGAVTMFGTDHAPHTYDEKTQEFDSAPGGIPGVETCMPMAMEMVRAGEIPLQLAVRMGAEAPCDRFSVHKGRIAVGNDADLLLFDMRKVSEIDIKRLHTKTGFTPYQGMRAVFPDTVVIRGQVQVRGGEFCGEPLGRDICA